MDFKKLTRGIFGGSVILLVTINIFNIINYFFHFFMVRMMTPADYGILAALMSLVFIFTIPSESIQTIFTKYSSSEANKGKLKNIVKRAIKKLFNLSIIAFAIFALAALPLSRLLNINYLLVLFTGIFIIPTFIIPVSRGLMQGTKRFNALGFNMIFEAVLKIILAISLVYFGFRVYGAIAGVILGSSVAILLSFFSLRDIFFADEKKAETKLIYIYSLPIITTVFVIMTFLYLDIIIARIVFAPEIAGYYAIASMIAKIIFFGTLPISKVMFSISSSNEAKKKNKIIYYSAIILLLCVAAALLLIYFLPDLFVRIFSGRYISEVSNILIYVSLATSLISITNLILLYKISLGEIKNYYALILFLAVEVALLFIFRHNLFEYSIAFVTASAIFLWGSTMLLGKQSVKF